MAQADSSLLGKLAHLIARNRRKVIGAWIVLTLFGGFAAGQVSKRWYQSFSIPGKSAYEANQRTLKAFGTGVRPPDEGGDRFAPAWRPGVDGRRHGRGTAARCRGD